MVRIKVVTDSGSDLPQFAAAQLNITVVPLTINFGDEQFRDSIDINPQTFYSRLQNGDHPSTTQPAPADFEAAYREVAKDADVIISCHLSGELSGTGQSAVIAGRELDIPVHVIDTRSASLGAGHIAMEAARMAKAGASVDKILERVESIIAEQKVLFIVDTLEYLQRNGRIGRAQAFVGGLLNIKPLLTLDDGSVAPLERARGRNAALSRLAARLQAHFGRQTVRVGIMHGDVPEEAEALQQQLVSVLNVDEMTITQLGPTIGAHIGPGGLGVVCYPVA